MALALVGVGAILIAAIAFVAVRVLGESQPRLSGTNAAFPSEPVTWLAPGHQACQLASSSGRNAERSRSITNERVRGRGLTLSVLDGGGRTVATAGAPSMRAGNNRFELASPSQVRRPGRVCLANARGGVPVLLIGSLARTGLGIDHNSIPGAISITFLRPGRERLISMVPVVAERIGRVRGHLGGPGRAVVIALCFLLGAGLAGWLFVGLAASPPATAGGLDLRLGRRS